MKKYIVLSFVLFSVLLISCSGNTEKETKNNEEVVFGETKVEIYYFHGNRRCPNCNAIENVAKDLIEKDYSNNSDVKFFAINFEENANKEIAAKYDITWSSLLVVSGEKSINLTMDAFQYAMSSPDYLKGEIKEVIESFLK